MLVLLTARRSVAGAFADRSRVKQNCYAVPLNTARKATAKRGFQLVPILRPDAIGTAGTGNFETRETTQGGSLWARPDATYLLPRDEVHVWRAKLEWPAECIVQWYQILSLDERERSDKFHFPADRRRHIIGRALSRILIARCLGINAINVSFKCGARGKPCLASDPCKTSRKFNISHSGDYVLVALAYGRDLGVDIERIRKDFDPDVIAERFFSKCERRSLAALPQSAKHNAFFACWTRKEAYVKARGDGLNLPLEEFDVAFLPEQEARLLATRGGVAEAGRLDATKYRDGE